MTDTRPKILLIDDTPLNLYFLEKALEQEFDVQIATSGLQGIALAQQAPPDLILLDVMMPGMDGFETCARLKADPLLQAIPVIFVTALDDHACEVKGLAMGAADYITKPVNVDIARLRIRNRVEHERLRKNIEVQRVLLEAKVLELSQAKAELQASEARLLAIIHAEPECIKVVDQQGLLVQMNPAGLAMVEADALEQVAGQPVVNLVAPPYQAAFTAMHQKVLAGEPVQMEFEVVGLKGGRRWLETHAVPMQDKGRTVQLAITRDITESRQAQEKLQLAASVFTSAREGIMITTADSRIIDVNDAFTHITGYTRDEVLGQSPRILGSQRHGQEFYAAMWHALIRVGYWSGEIWNRRKNGELYVEQLTISAVGDAQGKTQQYVALFSDVTERKQMEDHVRQLAFYDPLTTLPNRRLLSDRLNQTLMASKRNGKYGALMFLDLDNFKPLNDAHGHETGDLLLVDVAQRLKACVREADTVARFGGDEFVVIINELDAEHGTSAAQAGAIAEKIRASLSQPYVLNTRKQGQADSTVEHRCSVTIGVALFYGSEASQSDILKWADAAMYRAKDAGRNCIRFYGAAD
jgi:diguanylate cyclase (GGDEF)-like protein/PAS domain S-box-containing protein